MHQTSIHEHDATDSVIGELSRHLARTATRALDEDLPVMVTIHGADAIETIVARADRVRLSNDGILTIGTAEEDRTFRLIGPDTGPVLPTITVMDAMDEVMTNAKEATRSLRSRTGMLDVDDGHGIVRILADAVMVTSTGIYPSNGLGMDWDGTSTLVEDDDGITVTSSDGTLRLSAAV
jgi:hypothetical protein